MAASKAFPIRLTEQEHELLKQLAAYHDRDRSGLVRWLIRQEAKRVGLIRLEVGNTSPGDPDDDFEWKEE